MIQYLITADILAGRLYAIEKRDWRQIGVNRFITPDRHDIRLIKRFTDVTPFPTGTWFIKAPDFDSNPNAENFTKLVEQGIAQWSDLCEFP